MKLGRTDKQVLNRAALKDVIFIDLKFKCKYRRAYDNGRRYNKKDIYYR